MRKDDEKAMKLFSGSFTEGEALSLMKEAEKLPNIALDEKLGWILHFVKGDKKKLKKYLTCLENRAENNQNSTQKPIYKARAEEVKALLKQA